MNRSRGETMFEPVPESPDLLLIEGEMLKEWAREGLIARLIERGGKRSKMGLLKHPISDAEGFDPDRPHSLFRFERSRMRIVEESLDVLWRIYRWFVEEANRHRPYLKTRPFHHVRLNNVDRWVLARSQQLIPAVLEALSESDLERIGRDVARFSEELAVEIQPLLSARLETDESSEGRRATFASLFEVLMCVVRSVAPAAPFLTDVIYRNLIRPLDETDLTSVHLCPLVRRDPLLDDRAHLEDMTELSVLLRRAKDLRAQLGIEINRPLGEVAIAPWSERARSTLLGNERMICDELGVVRLSLDPTREGNVEDTPVRFDLRGGRELAWQGEIREFAAALREHRRVSGLEEEDVVVFYECARPIQPAMDRFLGFLKAESGCLRFFRGFDRMSESTRTQRASLSQGDVVFAMECNHDQSSNSGPSDS